MFYTVLKTEAEKQSRSENIIEGENISFQNVTIKTPAGYELVRDLTFDVGQSDSMLLTGAISSPFASYS